LAANPPVHATGRRKESVARVRLVSGDGKVVINEKSPKEYLGRSVLVQAIHAPLRAVEAHRSYDISIRVQGGGISGQAGAAVHGIARALCAADESFRAALKAAGFLTRDPRAKERKKPGLKRARKAPQYTKR
jgi:small subunit ribosomal protein S9